MISGKQAFLSTSLQVNDIMQYNTKNVIKIPGRKIRKAQKKLKQAPPELKAIRFQQLSGRQEQINNQVLFNNVNERQKRKEKLRLQRKKKK